MPTAAACAPDRLRLLEDELREARAELTRMEALEAQNRLLVAKIAEITAASTAEENPRRSGPAPVLTVKSSSFEFRLGRVLIDAIELRRGLMQLPGKLIALHRKSRALMRDRRKTAEAHANVAWLIEQVLTRLEQSEREEVLNWLTLQTDNPERQARVIIEAAREIRRRSPETAYLLCLEALSRWSGLDRAKWLSFALFDAGFVGYPSAILDRIDLRRLSVVERRRVDQIRSLKSGAITQRIPRPGTPPRGIHARSAISWTRQSLPYHLTPQTLRTSIAAEALMDHGWQVLTITEPGYHPGARDASLAEPLREVRGRHEYRRLPSLRVTTGDFSALGVLFAERLIAAIEASPPAVIIADGDFVLCQAGLHAARRCGVKCVLDLGQLRAPWLPPLEAEQSEERSRAALREFGAIARLADRVIVRSRTLADALAENGARADTLVPLPDPLPWVPPVGQVGQPARDEHGRPVLGYVGYISPTRGLLELIADLAPLAQEMAPRLLLAGPIQHRDRLAETADKSGFANHLDLPGRTPPEKFVECVQSIDIWLEPPPLTLIGRFDSPLELGVAMALKKPVVAPDIPLYREKLAGYSRAWFYPREPGGIAEAVRAALNGGAADGIASEERIGEFLPLAEWQSRYETVLSGASGW